MRQSLLAALALAVGLAGCSSVSTTTTTAPTMTVANAASNALPTFGDTDAVQLTDAERAAIMKEAKARIIDPKRPLIDIPGGVVDTRTGTRYACANRYGKTAQGGNPIPATIAGRFSDTGFIVLSVGVDDNRKTWEICNRLGLNIDWRAYE